MSDIERILRRGLTVGELRAALRDFDDDAHVVFASDYGDICHTTQALVVSEIEELVEGEEYLEESAYSHSRVAIGRFDDDEDEYEYDEEDDEDARYDDRHQFHKVVILR